MRKYDRESNTRIWSGWRAIVIKVFMACFAVYCICMTLFSTAMPEIRLPLFMGFIILAGFLNFPASKHHVRPNYLPWYDILLMLVGAACFFYFARNAMTMIRLATRIQPIHVVIGCYSDSGRTLPPLRGSADPCGRRASGRLRVL